MDLWNMNEKFPSNITLDEVKAIVEKNDEFILAVRDGYFVANYNVAFEDTFPPVSDRETAIRRELRGLIFNTDGEVVGRRFHKFFNQGEKPETDPVKLPWSQDYWFMEKLDGSMVSGQWYKDKYVYFSKMGETFVSDQVEAWLAKDQSRRDRYDSLNAVCNEYGATVIYEWVSPENRIVVDYKEPNLIVTAIRYNHSGNYLSPLGSERFAHNFGVPHAKVYPGIEINRYLAQMNEGEEGIVVVFENGERVKIKTEWYLRLHKVKSFFDSEKSIVELILNNELDDLMSIIDDDQKSKINKYSDTLHTYMHYTAQDIMDVIRDVVLWHVLDKKTFALKWKDNFPKFYSTFIFRNWDRLHELQLSDIFEAVVEYVMANTNTNRKFNEMKQELKWYITW